MYFCLRVDLDYVPWDSPDAAEFGHGEPAAFLRLLEFARQHGYRFHFFASERVLRAFPAVGDAVLNEGHALDWYCKHPDSMDRREEAFRLFEGLGHRPRGLAVKGSFPLTSAPGILDGMEFLSSGPGPAPEGIRHFPVETRPAKDAFRSGASLRTWIASAKAQVRDSASRNIGMTLAIRPQVIARADPRLGELKGVVDLAQAVGLEVLTLRELVDTRPR